MKNDLITGHVLDRDGELEVSEHTRPHWMQAGTIAFITMRLADSIPSEVVKRWDHERIGFLRQKNILCTDWRVGKDQLNDDDLKTFQKHFHRLREDHLDACGGKCQLRNPEAAKIVLDSLLHFDNDRYLLGDVVIMPNHMHLHAVFADADSMAKQCYSWMKYTAMQINRHNGVKGTLWQSEPFDHLVRSEKQLQYLRTYIKQNPEKAKLREGEYLYRKSNRHF